MTVSISGTASASHRAMEDISVIIPSYNETEETLAKCVRSVEQHAAVCEVIIVEVSKSSPPLMGGDIGEGANCNDDFITTHPKARFLRAEKSRALQMNCGAEAALGELFLFIHADSFLESGAIEQGLKCLDVDSVSLVSFDLKFDGDGRAFRLVESGTRFRNRISNTPYGDQCYLVRRDDFFAVGGFAPVPILEDVKFVVKMKKLGRVEICSASVFTSVRRYEKKGIIKTYLTNRLVMLLYYLRVSPWFIKKIY